MIKKKVVIFESVKGAGKTILTTALADILKNVLVYGEEFTLAPIRHIQDKETLIAHYQNLIKKIHESNATHILLDRFHYTKWPSIPYEKDYFKSIEELLLEKFEPIFIFLKIEDVTMLSRLIHTQKHREVSGWSAGNVSLAEEAEKDIVWQRFFLENQYTDTLIKDKAIISTNTLHENIHNLQPYLKEILTKISLR